MTNTEMSSIVAAEVSGAAEPAPLAELAVAALPARSVLRQLRSMSLPRADMTRSCAIVMWQYRFRTSSASSYTLRPLETISAT